MLMFVFDEWNYDGLFKCCLLPLSYKRAAILSFIQNNSFKIVFFDQRKFNFF